jgi:hypothetical protein
MSSTALAAIRYLVDAAISADTDLGSRIYMSQAPQPATYPLAVMEIVSREESPTQYSGSAMDTFRIQVDVFAKNGSSRSGFEAAHTLADQLRVAWARDANYTNLGSIDGIQEVNHSSDFVPDFDVYRVTNDYMIRVIDPEYTPPDGGYASHPEFSGNYSEDLQIWPYSKHLGLEVIYWQTWVFTNPVDGYQALTGLAVGSVGDYTEIEAVAIDDDGNRNNLQVGELKDNGGDDYEVMLFNGHSKILVTVKWTNA